VTNAPAAVAEDILRAAGLRQGLDLVLGAGPGLLPKPAPDMVVAAARGLGLVPEEVALVGDTRFDVDAARAAAALAIGVGGIAGDVTLGGLDDLEGFLAAQLD